MCRRHAISPVFSGHYQDLGMSRSNRHESSAMLFLAWVPGHCPYPYVCVYRRAKECIRSVKHDMYVLPQVRSRETSCGAPWPRSLACPRQPTCSPPPLPTRPSPPCDKAYGIFAFKALKTTGTLHTLNVLCYQTAIKLKFGENC